MRLSPPKGELEGNALNVISQPLQFIDEAVVIQPALDLQFLALHELQVIAVKLLELAVHFPLFQHHGFFIDVFLIAR